MTTKSRDLSAILQQVHLASTEEVLKAANAALKVSKSDSTAHRARITALLKLDRYSDALQAFDHGGPTVRQDAPFELAYALYKAGEPNNAKAIVERQNRKTRGLMHVAAQTVRNDRFQGESQLANPS
jgi:signal recognition particle subunit SRP72